MAIQAFQVFIPGKNWKLSLAELTSFLEERKSLFEVCAFSKEFFVTSVDDNVSFSDIAGLGGTIKIGKVLRTFPTENLKNAFLQKNKEQKTKIRTAIASGELIDELIKIESKKIVFGVSVYCAVDVLRHASKIIHRFVGSTVKRELAGYSRKARFIGFPKDRKQPQLSHVEVLKQNLVDNKAEILFCVGKEQTFVATTIAVHNPFEFQKRDVGKPVQRKIFAIPPRLARIMVNLAGCTEGKVFLDPFCGVGTIVQEALLSKAKAIGVDINAWCVEAARRNMEWLKDEYELENAEYRVLQGDVHKLSQKIGWEQVDCIATEPDLGPAMHQVPTTSYAIRIAEKLEPLYYGLLEEAYKVLKSDGRLVLVSPYIKTRSRKPVTLDIEGKAVELGFKQVSPFKSRFFEDDIVSENLLSLTSFVDVEERHKVGREIHVFQKVR